MSEWHPGVTPNGAASPPPGDSGPSSNRRFVVAGVLAVVTFIAAVLVFTVGGESPKKAVVVSGGTSSSASSSSTSASTKSSAPATTADATTTTSGATGTTAHATTTSPAVSDVTVLQKGFAVAAERGDPTTQIVRAAAVVQNMGSTTTGEVTGTFTFTDSNGATLGTETDFTTFLAAGEKGYLVTDSHVRSDVPVAGLTVSLTVEPMPDTGATIHTFPVTGAQVTQSSASYKAVVATLTNDLTTTVDAVQVICAIRNADGVLLAGATSFSDKIDPGGTIEIKALIESDLIPTATAAECRAAPSAITSIG